MFFKKIKEFSHTLLFRLTFLYASIFIISTTITFMIFYNRIYSVAIHELDSEMGEEINRFKETLKESGLNGLMETIRREVEVEEAEEEFYHLMDDQGQTIVATDLSLWQSIPAVSFNDLRSKKGQTHYQTVTIKEIDEKARILTVDLGENLILQTGESLEEVDEYLEIFQALFIVLIFVLLFVAVGIGWLLARRALRDVQAVTKTAEEIAKGYYKQRVPDTVQFSEVKRLSEAINCMLDHIDLLLNSLRDMNDNIAHELRSPLTRIRGFAEMSILDKSSVEDFNDMAINTVEECDNLIDMINMMLDITEAETGINSIKNTEFDLVKLINEACELLKPVAEEKNISVEYQSDDSIMFIRDQKKMQRVIINLMENAIKYTPNGGTIKIESRIKDGQIRITLSDTGMGIAKEELPHIFKRFYRCDQSRQHDGVGLGLSLVKAYVESMSGLISVESEVGQGSTFTLLFSSPTI